MWFSDGMRHATLAVARVLIGLLFMQHGVQKLFGWLGGVDGQGGTAELVSLMGLAGGLELVGGLLLVLGLLTQPVGLILMIEMIWAYVQAHMPQGGLPVQNEGELALIYAAAFLVFGTWGAGRYSVDALLGRAPQMETHAEPEETRRAA